MSLTKAAVIALRKDIEAALAKAGVQGVDFQLGNCRYSSNEATFKLTARVAGTATRGESCLSLYARMDGVDHNGVGPKGEKLVEYHTRKPKYPYIYVTRLGKKFKCTSNQAKNMFGIV